MASLNLAQIIGRLGRDPELRYTSSGQAVCSLNVATDESYNDRDGKLRLVDSTYDVLRGSTYCWQMQIGVKYIFN